jgi:hypothetical protein
MSKLNSDGGEEIERLVLIVHSGYFYLKIIPKREEKRTNSIISFPTVSTSRRKFSSGTKFNASTITL